MATQGKWGTTAPLSDALPKDIELQATDTLMEELKRQNNFESAEDTAKRAIALARLQEIVEVFVKKALKAEPGPKPEPYASRGGGKVFTFGSFRLGVFGPGSDIDTLMVGPKYVTREQFFQFMPDLLYEMAPPGAITGLTPVTEAFVPIIKFEWNGISIDLIYSRIAVLDSIPPDQTLSDNQLLRGLEETDLRSLNGTRVTDAILESVPQKAIFRNALRCIKLWAQRRAIYANIMGFPGGVAWAMLVARVCQLYPKATTSIVVLKFFKLMAQWQWPMPVLLRNIETGPLTGQVKVWNPKIYRGDSFHLMPIITPAYPSMCATHNITRSTMAIILQELKRGGEITDNIISGKGQWKDLFVKHTFFTHGYKYYLAVISASTTKEAQKLWSGLVESKVRLLVQGLENHDSIALAHPFNKGFDRIHRCKNEEEIEKAKAGSLDFQIPDTTEVTDPADVVKGDGIQVEEDAKHTIVYTSTHYIGLELREGARSLDLSWQVDEFKRKCHSWDRYDEKVSALNTGHTKNYDLPDDVFNPGETKPARPAKKKTVNGKKRNAPDDNTPTSGSAKRQQHTSVAAAG